MPDAKPTASRAFGWDDIHPGTCCDCCGDHCPRSDHTPVHDQPIRFSHAGREWLTDRYVSLNVTILDGLPTDTEPPSGIEFDPMPTRASGPATGMVGDRTLDVLDRVPGLDLADSDVPGMHALTLNGVMVGFAKAANSGLPVEYLPRARRMSDRFRHLPETPLVAAADAILAWLRTDEDQGARPQCQQRHQ